MSNKYAKYEDRGLTGLANLGNTCYINSTMQVLSHCYDFNELLEKIDVENLNKVDDSVLLIEWKSLKDLMWSKNCIISPNRYLNSIQQISQSKKLELFSGFAQNDLPEFLFFVIDCFHNALKREVKMNIVGNAKNDTDILAKECYAMIKDLYSETYSELLNMFYGIHVSLIQNPGNYENLSVRPEPFCTINLPIPIKSDKSECSILECFDLYSQPEILEGENSWFNEKTNAKQSVYKSIKFWSLPNILIVDLKRFNNSNKKVNTLVTSPFTNLDLTKYVVGYDSHTYKYDLFGITNHSGGCLGGHYTAFVKNANNKWYHFNDTNVNEVDESKIITSKAYCFFYRKIEK